LFFTAGLELYRSDIFNEKVDFNKVSIQVSRRF